MAKNSGTAGTKVTIYDIARIAGINPSTVSRALGKPERVSAKTRKLVEQAAAELNFKANPLARALLTGRTGTIGLIVADITNPSYFDMIRGAQSAAAANDLTLVLAESAESASTESMVAQRIQPSTDGIILVKSPFSADLTPPGSRPAAGKACGPPVNGVGARPCSSPPRHPQLRAAGVPRGM